MEFFTSDLHLGHHNVIRLCNRPFANLEEMDQVLIHNWNQRVKKNDTVYIIGDIVFDQRKVAFYLEQLSGKKVLIAGNHDTTWTKKAEIQPFFEAVVPYLEVRLNAHPITMCHYPMLEWRASREKSHRKIGYHIHGHIHNRVTDSYLPLYRQFNALNAGVDINGFAPVTFEELIKNNDAWKLSCLQTQADREYLLAGIQSREEAPK